MRRRRNRARRWWEKRCLSSGEGRAGVDTCCLCCLKVTIDKSCTLGCCFSEAYSHLYPHSTKSHFYGNVSSNKWKKKKWTHPRKLYLRHLPIRSRKRIYQAAVLSQSEGCDLYCIGAEDMQHTCIVFLPAGDLNPTVSFSTLRGVESLKQQRPDLLSCCDLITVPLKWAMSWCLINSHWPILVIQFYSLVGSRSRFCD